MRREFWFLFLILVIAVLLRLWALPGIPPGLYPDEAMNGNNALESLATGDFKVFYPENNGREGLFINIQSASVALFGNEPWVLRLPSAIFGILTVLGIFFLTRELFKGNKDASLIALLAAFLLATSFWHINFSRIGFRAIMAPAFLTWGIYLLLLSLDRLKTQISNFKTWLLPVLAGAIYGLGMHSYIAYRATPLLIIIIIAAYWFKNKDRVARKQILLSSFYFLISSIIVFFPLGLYFFEHPADFFGRTSELSVFASNAPLENLALNTLKTLGMFNVFGDYNWRHNLSGEPQLFWPVGIMFVVGLMLALRHFIRDARYMVLLAWLVIAMLPVVISNEGLPHALRAILMIPPVFILAGVGGVGVYNLFRKVIHRPRALKAVSLALLLFILLNSYFTYFVRWARNPNTADAFTKKYVEIGRQLNALPENLPKYVIVEAGGVDVRGLPMPTQTVMFLTDTFTPEKQTLKNIRYLLPNQVKSADIPGSAAVFTLD